MNYALTFRFKSELGKCFRSLQDRHGSIEGVLQIFGDGRKS